MLFVGYILTALAAYLLGSLATGFWLGKARGIDIRTVGSGNIGATNVFRALGVPAGIFVLIADALKGWLAVALIGPFICGRFEAGAGSPGCEWFKIIAGIAAILGHNYTCWLRFKGGKGIATSAGVLVGLVPVALLISLGIWVIMAALFRYVSLASITGALSLPFATWLTTGGNRLLTGTTAVMAALAVYKHKSNIRRLLNGTENKLGAKTKTASVESKPTK